MNIGLGTASFGTSITKKDSFDVLDKFIELGGEIIDTANNYAFWDEKGKGGESEQVIGEWLKDKQRSKMQIHTKIGAQPVDGKDFENLDGLGRTNIFSSVEKSLNRLNTDYVDVLYAHVDDYKTPLKETWEAFTELTQKGVVKKVGVSNYTPERLAKLLAIIRENDLEPIKYAQYRHSVIPPKKDADFGVQVCFNGKIDEILKSEGQNARIVAYSPLLDGAFEKGNELSPNYATSVNYESLNNIRSEATKLGVSPSALVLHRLSEAGLLPLTMTGKVSRLEASLALFN